MNQKDLNKISPFDCPICSRQYDDPMILKCGHTFCASCINTLKNGISSKITCPITFPKICRKESPINSITVNYTVKEIIEEKQKVSIIKGIYLTTHDAISLLKDEVQTPTENKGTLTKNSNKTKIMNNYTFPTEHTKDLKAENDTLYESFNPITIVEQSLF